MRVAAITLCWLIFLTEGFLTISAHASPLPPQGSLLARRGITLNNATGIPEIFDDDGSLIPQGLGSDGSGYGFSAAAVLWIVFCFLIGIPISIAGIRCWKVTTAAGIGLTGAVFWWAAFSNSVNNIGLPDVVMTILVLCFFLLGFALGFIKLVYIAGLGCLGVVGGMAFGLRIVLLKDGLLFSKSSSYFVNWLLISSFGILGLFAIVCGSSQRAGIATSSASIGTFLTFLGLDLCINKQSGISRGLRYFFDRNEFHALDLFFGGYHPSRSTQIILIISLVLTPILALLQHFIFKNFSHDTRRASLISCSASGENELTKPPSQTPEVREGDSNTSHSRFST